MQAHAVLHAKLAGMSAQRGLVGTVAIVLAHQKQAGVLWHRRQHIDKKELVLLLAQPAHATKHGLIELKAQLDP